MTETNHTLALRGCAPVPLAHYLKALGILRLVSEQADPHAVGWWENDVFYLRSRLDEAALLQFFLEDYKPTPLVGPWGARSGFYPTASEKSARAALAAINSSKLPRLSPFRSAIDQVHSVLERLGLDQKPDGDEEKLRLLRECRATLTDDLLQWLDAVYVLLNDNTDVKKSRAFPPLLGTGGNEGSGSYMSGFAQQIVSVVINRKWDHSLAPAIFSGITSGIEDKQTPGHFFPDAAGGANAGSGFDGAGGLNPWDFILLLEGTLLFASSAVKRLEDHRDGSLAYPFCVCPSGIGYPSASLDDEYTAGAEMWMPLWPHPATLQELEILFSEGRGTVDERKSRTGVDFARAVASLGTDRGVTRFERFGFQERYGQNNFAISLGAWNVPENASRPTALIAALDAWLNRFRSAAIGTKKRKGPAAARRALRRVETGILKLCERDSEQDVQALLIALGEAEAAVASSKALREGGKERGGINPLPLLSPNWLLHAADDSAEFRLAAALASVRHKSVGPIRRHVEPIDDSSWTSQWPRWAKEANDPAIVCGSGSLVRNLNAVLARRLVEVLQEGKEKGKNELLMPLGGRCFASLGDIAAFIDGDTDDERIDALFRGLMLLDFGTTPKSRRILGDKAKQLAETASIGNRDTTLLSLLVRFLPYDSDDKTLYVEAMRKIGPSERDDEVPDARYAMLKLCHLPHALDDTAVKLSPQITRRAIAGNGAEAMRLAARRLRASGFPPAVEVVTCDANKMRRIAAALMFPVSKVSAGTLMRTVIRCDELSEDEGAIKPAIVQDI